MILRPIKTEQQNRRYTKILLKLEEKQNSTAQEDELAHVLAALIEDFEAKFYPLQGATFHERLNALITRDGKQPQDLYPILGSGRWTSELLNGYREPTREQRRLLADYFRVSPLVFFLSPESSRRGRQRRSG